MNRLGSAVFPAARETWNFYAKGSRKTMGEGITVLGDPGSGENDDIATNFA